MANVHVPKSANFESRKWQAAAAVLSLLVVSMMIFRLSDAAFSATTDNSGSQWAAGSVALSDDDSTSAMFSVTGMKGGQTVENCIKATYSGSLDANVKLYASLTAGNGLDDYLDLTVTRGSGGSFGDCTGFTSDETVFASDTLDSFTTSHSSFGTGVGTWAPTGGGADDDMTYKFVVTLQSDNAAQGLTTTAKFTWEAQNT